MEVWLQYLRKKTAETANHLCGPSGDLGYFLKRTFLMILSLLIWVISPVREIGGNFQSQSASVVTWRKVAPVLGRKWTAWVIASDRLGFTN